MYNKYVWAGTLQRGHIEPKRRKRCGMARGQTHAAALRHQYIDCVEGLIIVTPGRRKFNRK